MIYVFTSINLLLAFSSVYLALSPCVFGVCTCVHACVCWLWIPVPWKFIWRNLGRDWLEIAFLQKQTTSPLVITWGHEQPGTSPVTFPCWAVLHPTGDVSLAANPHTDQLGVMSLRYVCVPYFPLHLVLFHAEQWVYFSLPLSLKLLPFGDLRSRDFILNSQPWEGCRLCHLSLVEPSKWKLSVVIFLEMPLGLLLFTFIFHTALWSAVHRQFPKQRKWWGAHFCLVTPPEWFHVT